MSEGFFERTGREVDRDIEAGKKLAGEIWAEMREGDGLPPVRKLNDSIALEKLAKQFNQIDTNGNGSITPDEVNAYMKKHASELTPADRRMLEWVRGGLQDPLAELFTGKKTDVSRGVTQKQLLDAAARARFQSMVLE